MVVIEPDCPCSQKQITHERYIFPQSVFGSTSFPATIELVGLRGLKAGFHSVFGIRTGGLEVCEERRAVVVP